MYEHVGVGGQLGDGGHLGGGGHVVPGIGVPDDTDGTEQMNASVVPQSALYQCPSCVPRARHRPDAVGSPEGLLVGLNDRSDLAVKLMP